MPQYLIAYLGGEQPSSPDEGRRHFARYQEWLQSLGDAAVSPANPFRHTHRVHPDGSTSPGSESAMSGYTVIEANSIEAAIAIAQRCPFLEVGGTLEVSEVGEMPDAK